MPDYHCPMPTPDGGVCGGELGAANQYGKRFCRKCLTNISSSESAAGGDQLSAFRAQYEELERLRPFEARAAEMEALLRRASPMVVDFQQGAAQTMLEYDGHQSTSQFLHAKADMEEADSWLRELDVVLSGAAPQAEKGGDDA